MHRSPSERAGSSLSAGKRGSAPQRLGLPVGDPEPVPPVGVAEQRRPEPEGDGQPARRQPDRLAGVVRRQVGRALDRADLAGRARRCVIRSAASVQRCSSAISSSRESVRDVEGREVQPVLDRGVDAGLVLAAEGVHRRRRCGCRWPSRLEARPATNALATPAAAAPPPRRPRRRPGADSIIRLRSGSGQHRGGQRRERLRQRVDRVRELLDLRPGSTRRRTKPSPERLRVEQRLQLGEPRRSSCSASSGSFCSTSGRTPS